MTRKPHRFDFWLDYHRSLGISHVFVHVEDTPGLLEELQTGVHAISGFVTATEGLEHGPSGGGGTNNSNNNYYTLMERQERHVRCAVSSCGALGIEWLFHVDDDELLHFTQPFASLVARLPAGVSCVVLPNVEAAPQSLRAECAFTEVGIFTQHRMLAYRNGKAAGRCAVSNWNGPHRFTGVCHVLPVAAACVLHFESCTYEGWRTKFLRHRDVDAQKKAEIPFPFYRDSISLFQADRDGGPDERRWKEFYRKRKVDHFEDLSEAQKIRLQVTRHCRQMID